MTRFLGWVLVVLMCGPVVYAGQERGRREVTPERIQRLIHATMQGSRVVRPQAARRLQRMGPVAHGMVLNQVEAGGDWILLGPDLLELAAQLSEPNGDGAAPGEFDPSVERWARLRRSCWQALEREGFPWRAALVSGLGRAHRAPERARFLSLLNDRMLAVRLAALQSLQTDASKSTMEALHGRIAEEREGSMRRALARRLFQLGHGPSLWVLYHELGRDDRFFDQPVGLSARLEAARFLKELLPEGPDLDVQARVDAPASVAGRARWRAHLEALDGEDPGRSGPVAKRGVEPRGEPIFGLELRSCRRGEFFLRWTDADQLWLGRGRPLCFDLKPGSHAGWIPLAQGTQDKMGDRHLTGQPGCDQESFHFRLPESTRTEIFLITKGPAPVPELRPAALNPLLRELLDSLGDASLPTGIEQGLRAALKDLGGEFRLQSLK